MCHANVFHGQRTFQQLAHDAQGCECWVLCACDVLLSARMQGFKQGIMLLCCRGVAMQLLDETWKLGMLRHASQAFLAQAFKRLLRLPHQLGVAATHAEHDSAFELETRAR